ncbi:MAG: OmpA family protein [Devosia sp.]
MTNTRLTWAVGILAALLFVLGIWNFSLNDRLAGSERMTGAYATRAAEADAQLATAATRQNELETALANLSIPDISGVQQELGRLGSQLTELQAELADVPQDQLSERLAAVETQLAALAIPSLQPLEQAATQSRADIDGLQRQVAALETNEIDPAAIDGLTERMDAVTAQVAAIEVPDTATITADLEQLQARIAAIETRPEPAAAPAEPDLAARITALEQQAAAASPAAPADTELQRIAASLASAEPAIAAAATKAELAAVVANVSALDTRTAELGTTTSALEGQLASLGDDVTRLASGQTDSAGLGAELSQMLAAQGDILAAKADTTVTNGLDTRIAALSEQVARLVANETTVADLRSEVDAVTERVEGLPSGDQITSLRSDVDELAAARPQPAADRLLGQISFGAGAAQVSDADVALLAALAARVSESDVSLEIVGFADTTGPADFNRGLSLRRASAVRAALVAAGVDPAAMTSVIGLGEDGPPVDTGDDAEEAQNRVVLIYQRP